MAWGTEFSTEVFLKRMSFKTRIDLDNKIQELEEELTSGKEILKMYAIASPKDIVSDNDDVVFTINNYVNTVFHDMMDTHYDYVLLKLFQEHLEETGEDIAIYYPFKEETDDRRENGIN